MLIGAQSYTIREHTQSERDFRVSMKKLADIGYKSVQLSAIGAIDPHILREVCDENGLKIVLTHTNAERMLTDTAGVIADHNVMGCDYIGVGMMPERYRTAETVGDFAKDFLLPAQKMRDAGKLMMYHNHNIEWEKVNEKRNMLDILLETMPADVMGLTLDTYWVQAAGADICDTIEAVQDRIPCVHLKDMSVKGFEQRMAVVGEGNIPFKKVLDLLKKLGKTKFILVEQDRCYGEDPFDCLGRSFDYLTRLGY
jgi:sugar phosphate isomerase/epimerase